MTPIDMLLYCPNCGVQHIDKDNSDELRIQAAELGIDREGDRECERWIEEREWTNPPHRSHLCASCGCIWRPADVCTNGVEAIKTVGQADSWSVPHNEKVTAALSTPAQQDAVDAERWRVLVDACSEEPLRLAAYYNGLMPDTRLKISFPTIVSDDAVGNVTTLADWADAAVNAKKGG